MGLYKIILIIRANQGSMRSKLKESHGNKYDYWYE